MNEQLEYRLWVYFVEQLGLRRHWVTARFEVQPAFRLSALDLT
jgi:hypothetical protein